MWYPPLQHGVVIHILRNCVLLYHLKKQLKNSKWFLVEIESKVGMMEEEEKDWVKDAKRANDGAPC